MSALQKHSAQQLLEIANLSVGFTGRDRVTPAVKDLSYTLNASETLGIVGESGSGKTQSVLSIMGLLPENAVVSGSVWFGGTELLSLSQKQLNGIRGKEIAMIFQDPMTSLNPHLTIGNQMSLVARRHLGKNKAAAIQESFRMLDAVRIPEAANRLTQYPHELSGGMRQRVMIATALLCQPQLLIADEPTTALDVTVQAQILDLMRELQKDFATSTLLITHDMGVVAGLCDRVLVMRQGENVEYDSVGKVFAAPQHEYTRALLAAVPRLNDPGTQLNSLGPEDAKNALKVSDLEVEFRAPAEGLLKPYQTLKALRGIGFSLSPGETLGVVGESGCGKSTLARALLHLLEPSAGDVVFLGDSLGSLSAKELQSKRTDMQIIFQDPLASLNPRMTVADILCEPLDTFEPTLSRHEKLQRAARLMKKVGLDSDQLYRYPHEFSGGQCQRIGIARALMFEPKLIVCDEPVSALDVSVQAKVVELLIELQKELGISLVFVAHDLAVVRQVSHRIMVMYLGKAVEIADRDSIYERPLHPYTQALIAAVPIPDPVIQRHSNHAMLAGDLPSPLNPPSGCAFRARCPRAQELCKAEAPALENAGKSLVACHFSNN
ncbi:MAG: ABC transporter ATP-binding protein [Gammaproteobacteria bacterium]|nr:ABC transporter ATP-binding protein [Gammaproteobacteria bacterium]